MSQHALSLFSPLQCSARPWAEKVGSKACNIVSNFRSSWAGDESTTLSISPSASVASWTSLCLLGSPTCNAKLDDHSL